MPWPPDTPTPQLGPKLLTREDVKERINSVLVEGFNLQELMFSKKPEDIEHRRWLLENWPEEIRIQKEWFFKYLERAMPSRVIHESRADSRKRVTPEDIESLGLTPEQLKKLAGIKDAE